MFYSECLTRNNLIVVIVNVIFFMFVQTLFFNLVASQQYVNVLKSKVDILNIFSQKDPHIRTVLSAFKTDYIKAHIESAKQQEALRKQHNDALAREHSYHYIALATVILVAVVLPMKSKEPWGPVDTLNILIVLLAYSTELLFFFFIVRKYEFVGDHYIMSSLAKEIKQISSKELS
jgi:hypothetical protein